MAEAHQFGSIFLSGKTGSVQGVLKLTGEGVIWKKAGGGKSVDLRKGDIRDITYSKVAAGFQISVRERSGSLYKFSGFRDQDLKTVRSFIKDNHAKEVVERSIVVAGHNWGEALVNGSMMTFCPVGNTECKKSTPYSFEISMADVSQVIAQKNKLVMEFHLDDTGSAAETDTLADISFYIPPTSTVHTPESEEQTPAQILREQLVQNADIDDNAGGDTVAAFSDIACLVPRLKVDIDLSLSMVHLQGTTQDFRIKHTSLMRIFMLPKPNMPHTVVVLTLDPPIRQGKTFYAHVLLQFPTDEEIEIALDLEEDVINNKFAGKLQPTYEGPSAEVFCKVLKGLSGCKITKPGVYVSHQQKKAVRCSLKADDGYLFPLEKSFFYITKPTTVLAYEEVAEVEFQRQGGGVSLSSAKTFDLKVLMKSDAEYQFRNISRSEYDNLFSFVQAKGLRVVNLAENSAAGAGLELSDDEDEDPGMRRKARAAAEGGGAEYESEEDEDFVADASSDGGEPTDESSDGESNASQKKASGSEDSDEEQLSKKAEKTKKRPAEKKIKGTPEAKRKKEDKSPGKKQKKKKDKNAPKRGMSAFMFFSNTNRNEVKAENPELGIGGIAKVLGERWKALTADDKVQYDEMAAEDKIRYEKAKKIYAQKLKDDASAPADDNQEEQGSEGDDEGEESE